MSQPSVTVENLSKCYRVFPDARHRVKELLSFGKKKYHLEKWALRDINFELFPGQALGIVGINGSGKSTLLKVLTGTTRQTTGHYAINGNLSSLLELGAGFHPDFSGKQNIYMNAVMQGVGKDDVDARYEEIAAFTELGTAMERPVRTYSSGMAMRLGFAASMLVNPDVLILDEVLAVGDSYFQKKCMEQFHRFRSEDKTILFVSHSVYHVREICDRVIWLHQGEMVMDGNPIEVTDEYETRLLEEEGRQKAISQAATEEVSARAGLARIERVMVSESDVIMPSYDFVTGDPLSVRAQIEVPDPGENLQLVVAILRNDGLLVLSGRSETRSYEPGRHLVTMDLPALPLLAGEYMVSVYVTDASGAHIGDQMLNVERFRVATPRFEKGLVLAEYSFRHATEDEIGRDLREIKA